MVESVTATPRKGRQKDKFEVGDLVLTKCTLMVYMLVPRDQSFPSRTGTGTVSGVLVHKNGMRDRDGDPLPVLGYLHTNIGENNLTLSERAVHLQN